MPKSVKCPYCKQPSTYSEANLWRPFCSERCQTMDLGHWASEKYSVAGETVTSHMDVNKNPPDNEDPSGEALPTQLM